MFYFFALVSIFCVVSAIILFDVSVDILLVVSVVIVDVESAALFSLSTLLLQAVMTPAIARIASNFFILLWFDV
jgi:hypothetical protein